MKVCSNFHFLFNSHAYGKLYICNSSANQGINFPALMRTVAVFCLFHSNDIEYNGIKMLFLCYDHSHKVPGSNGSRNGVKGRDFVKLWYEGGIPLWNENPNFGT